MQPMTLTPEQHEFRAVVRQFAEDKLGPLAAETDQKGEYSWPAFEALKAMELTALSFPEEYGGAGADLVTQAIVVEELARVDASASLMFLISKLAMMPVLNFGTEELKARYVPRIASGESQGSYCLSEADAGSDVASMAMRAVRDGDDYVLTGYQGLDHQRRHRRPVHGLRQDRPGAGHRGISAFVVEKDWGVQVTKLEHKMGIKGSPTAQIVLDEVRVPVANLHR